jgi:hypothetical protein
VKEKSTTLVLVSRTKRGKEKLTFSLICALFVFSAAGGVLLFLFSQKSLRG